MEYTLEVLVPLFREQRAQHLPLFASHRRHEDVRGAESDEVVDMDGVLLGEAGRSSYDLLGSHLGPDGVLSGVVRQ